MNFDLSEEHRMLQETVRAFVAKEVAPRARHVDETGEFPWETLQAMAKLGLLGLNVPEAYGGSGADYLSVALMLAEIGKGCGSTGLIVAAHLGLACGPLTLFGSEAQKQRWLVPMAQGKMLGCLGLTEPGAGSDLRGIRTTAVRDGESWIINGSKMWLTNGAEAGLAILLVRTGEKFSHFLVPTDTPGVSFGPPEKKMGLHGSHTYAVSLEDVRVPAENLLGVEGRGLAQTLQVLDGGRIGIASLSLGLAEAAFDAAAAYATNPPDLRPTADRAPGGRLHAGRHGRRDRSHPLADLPRRVAARPRPAAHERGIHRQARRHRDGRAGRPERDPDPRRLRLQQRVPGGTHLPRRPADDHRRGDERDAADGDCARTDVIDLGVTPIRDRVKPA